MKKAIITAILLIAAVTGLIIADNKTEDGLINEIKYTIMPDPMANNRYDEGQCTHYIFEEVKADGNMIESDWSDAKYWSEKAEEDGYTVNSEPAEGAILQTEQGKLGHVAYIESVNDDGSIEISEMNLVEAYEITERTIKAEDIAQYDYIHPQENPYDKREDEAQ
ncbi:CHAP domain-containing protein [Salinicoccus sp. HZC-1]|uniref:CHAP domain-containing protein n=1 Tax=Salinicoccus sp. HZC-1 TaxID=3385497 RepID=UPI00398B0833